MRTILILAALAALTACESQQAVRERQLRVDAIARVNDRLRDPDGARWLWIAVSPYAAAPTVCGEVNPRNGFGGFYGTTRVMVTPTDMVFLTPAAEAARFQQWAAWCQIPAPH